MKTLITILLALTLFSCKKNALTEPTFENKPQPREVTRVTINTYGWWGNYKLKYKRTSGWVDTIINQQHYSVQYQCYTNELQHPVKLYSAETYDKDTLRLKLTVNTTIQQEAIVNKVEVQCVLQPSNAM